MRRSGVGAGHPATSAAPVGRADRVLAALRHFARGGIACELPSTLARWLGISADTVQRGIRDLLIDGRIERTPMRAGKATAYRLVESPQPDDASPHESSPAAPIGAGGPLKGLPPAPQTERRNDFAADEGPDAKLVGRDPRHSRPAGSPMSDADRKWMATPPDPGRFEWPEFRAAARWMQSVGVGGNADVVGLQQTGSGTCADCKQEAESRSRFGRSLELCRPCVGRRQAVALKFASEVGRAMPSERDRLERNIKAPVRVEWRNIT